MGQLTASRTEIIIEPPQGLARLDSRELWEYRDLLFLLVRRDLVARYQQTLLGPLWHLLQPLLTTAIFVLVFARVGGISTGGVPAPLFYLSGLLGWNYFAQNLSNIGATFQNNQHLFSKVWFPRLIIPFSTALANLAALGLQFVPFVALALFYGCVFQVWTLSWHLVLLPLAILHIVAVSLGVGLWMAAISARYRDLMHMQQFLVQLWMFATPIIYPLSQIPSKWVWLTWFNPMTAPIESFRWCLLGQGGAAMPLLLSSMVLAGLLLVTGVMSYQAASSSAVDTV